MIEFQIKKQFQNARIGKLITAHGEINTPVFMPVGTQAAFKSLTMPQLEATGSQIMLCNTYHLMRQPGEKIIKLHNGLHNFSKWNKPILTDSGGFQVMSLNSLRKITEEGVTFRDHITGKKILLTPENITQAQHMFNSDISMIFDECTPTDIDYRAAKKSMHLSLRWAERSKAAFIDRALYGQFGIVQGSKYLDLRRISANHLINMNFDGYAIGGVIGYADTGMLEVLDHTIPMLPFDKPRYLMGVGKPQDIISSMIRGIDMCDCVLPARSARHGQIFSKYNANNNFNIRKAIYKEDLSPMEFDCNCFTCKNFSKSYIHHLFRAKEILGLSLATIHNITFYQDFVKMIHYCINEENWKYMKEKYPFIKIS